MTIITKIIGMLQILNDGKLLKFSKQISEVYFDQ